MSFPRTVSVALLTACAVIFFVAVPAAEPAGVASAQLPQPDPSGQATPSREQGPANAFRGSKRLAPQRLTAWFAQARSRAGASRRYPQAGEKIYTRLKSHGETAPASLWITRLRDFLLP
jgi:hypothetical protein